MMLVRTTALKYMVMMVVVAVEEVVQQEIQ